MNNTINIVTREQLSGLQLFKETQQLIDNVNDKVEILSLREGDFLFRTDEEADGVYVVMRGEIEVLKEGRVIATISRDGILGETAIFSQKKRNACAKAKEYTQVIRINNDAFLEFMSNEPSIASQISDIVLQRS